MIKQFSSKFGLNDTVVVNLGNNRLFGNITAVKFEDQIIKYDIYLEGMKVYDVLEYYVEKPSEHQDLSSI